MMAEPELTIRRIGADENRPLFTCGCNPDLDEYFTNDSKTGDRELMSVTYAVECGREVVAFFCLSNDSIRAEDTTRSRFKKLSSIIPSSKRYKNIPAVKIGRLATHKDRQSQGIGKSILDFLKVWFTDGNKTGCRFIVVDANNNERSIKFYKKNGFDYLDICPKSEKEKTRLMFFDLITFKE